MEQSESSSSKASTKETKKPENDALKLEKQKVKVLKKALQEERKTKVSIEKELKESHDQVVNLKESLADKVSALIPGSCCVRKNATSSSLTRRFSSKRR
jgi:tryptophanyl-tRNA synthetase